MKFLLLTNNDNDGIGQHAARLNDEFISLGHQSKTLVLHKTTKNKNIIKIQRSILKRIFYFPLNFLKKQSDKLFSFGFAGIGFNVIKSYIHKADIIIIYSFFNALSIDDIEKLLNTKKIIYFRALDMELASGGCHVNFDYLGNECKKYEANCSTCPQLNFLNIFNLSKKIIFKKKKILEKYKPRVLVENTFTKNLYQKSFSCKNLNVQSIFLGINEKRSMFIKKHEARNKLKFNLADKIILFGTFNLDAKHKGGEKIQNFLEILSKKLNITEKVKLVTFGRKQTFNINVKNIQWLHLGVIRDDNKLNLLYRAADLMLSPSTGCNGPHIVNEAISNNLPVIAFEQGVAIDAILNNINGFKIKCFDEELFAKKIYDSLFNIKFDFNNEKNKKIKKLFTSNSEAKEIIKISNNDLINL
jgi:glycosyltransferase involved in cell wall biosynthesis